MIRRQLLFASLVYFAGILHVQSQILNVDHRQFANDTIDGWLGDVQVNFSFNNLNNATAEQDIFLYLSGNGNLSYFTEKDHYYLKNYLAYGEGGGFTFVSQGYTHLRVDLNYRKRFSPEIFGQIQYDITRKMRLRAVTGLGYRYVFFRSDKAELEYGLAGILEHEQWDPIREDQGASTRTLPKLATYFGVYRTFSHVKISLLQFYQVGFDPTDDRWRNRLSGTFEVDDEIVKNLHLVIQFNYDYDFDPIVDDLKKIFYSLNNGIKYKF